MGRSVFGTAQAAQAAQATVANALTSDARGGGGHFGGAAVSVSRCGSGRYNSITLRVSLPVPPMWIAASPSFPKLKIAKVTSQFHSVSGGSPELKCSEKNTSTP